jgi:hypothetical protein
MLTNRISLKPQYFLPQFFYFRENKFEFFPTFLNIIQLMWKLPVFYAGVFLGEISPKFDLKNTISNYSRVFS